MMKINASLFGASCSNCPYLGCWDANNPKVRCSERLCGCYDEDAYHCLQCTKEKIITWMISHGFDYTNNKWIDNANKNTLLNYIGKEMVNEINNTM